MQNSDTKKYPNNELYLIFEKFVNLGCNIQGFDEIIKYFIDKQHQSIKMAIILKNIYNNHSYIKNSNISFLIAIILEYSTHQIINRTILYKYLKKPDILSTKEKIDKLCETLKTIKLDIINSNEQLQKYKKYIFDNIIRFHTTHYEYNRTPADHIAGKDILQIIDGFTKCLRFNLINPTLKITNNNISYLLFAEYSDEKNLQTLKNNNIKLEYINFDDRLDRDNTWNKINEIISIRDEISWDKQKLSTQNIITILFTNPEHVQLIQQYLITGKEVETSLNITD